MLFQWNTLGWHARLVSFFLAGRPVVIVGEAHSTGFTLDLGDGQVHVNRGDCLAPGGVWYFHRLHVGWRLLKAEGPATRSLETPQEREASLSNSFSSCDSLSSLDNFSSCDISEWLA